jgi:hypothetical protein
MQLLGAYRPKTNDRMSELADDPDLESGARTGRGGSNPPPVTERNYMDDVVTLRTKLKSAGWNVRELPVRSNDIVKSWKIIAAKGERTITIGGTTLDEALHNLARTVGVVANRALHS